MKFIRTIVEGNYKIYIFSLNKKFGWDKRFKLFREFVFMKR